MATTCLQLLSLQSFSQIRLVAGETGLYRKLSWPHICVMPSISQWLHGGELLFVTGTSFDTNETTLMKIIQESVQENLAGVVLLVGGESRLVANEAMRNFANENDFPLFEMPWSLKLVDVIQEISELIISQKSLDDTQQRFFFEMLFSPDRPKKFEELSALYSMPSYSHLAVAILHPCAKYNIDLSDIIQRLSFYYAMSKNISSTALIPVKHIGNVVCLILANSEKSAIEMGAFLERFASSFAQKFYQADSLKLTFSSIASSSTSVQVLYTQADMTLRVLDRMNFSSNQMHYDQLGIYKLFFEVPEETRKNFWQEHIGALICEDTENASRLLETLRCYMSNGCNAVTTSKQLFIHKNTLFYRLGRIRSILNVDINDPTAHNNIYNALLLYDVFNNGD